MIVSGAQNNNFFGPVAFFESYVLCSHLVIHRLFTLLRHVSDYSFNEVVFLFSRLPRRRLVLMWILYFC
jgi:hypothetical protein